MSTNLTPGKRVRQKVTPIEGDISDIRWEKSSNGFQVLVSYTGADGEEHSRWFDQADVEEVMPEQLAQAAVAKAAAKPVAPSPTK